MTTTTNTGAVAESTIRKMTRLAHEYGAVNLSQGFPNESPPEAVKVALAYSVLTGRQPPAAVSLTTRHDLAQFLLRQSKGEHSETSDDDDVTNQYSPPMGRLDVRQAVAAYYQALYEYSVGANEITLTLGATEALASALRTLGKPGDKVVIIEPFHELYPSQCAIFHLEPIYVTLKETANGDWTFDTTEMQQALAEADILLLNTPHNPTGKVFDMEELTKIVEWCMQSNVTIVTDEIYEHMVYPNDVQHHLLPKLFPQARGRILVCNSIGKSASATGWRLGWCLHPPHLTEAYRGVHDQMVVMSPHPMQVAALTYLKLPLDYFRVELKQRYQQRIEKLSMVLKQVGFHVSQPQGAYYLFCSYKSVAKLGELGPMEAAMYMVRDVGVACVPGDNFYGKARHGDNYLRFAACRSVQDVDAACKLLIDKLL